MLVESVLKKTVFSDPSRKWLSPSESLWSTWLTHTTEPELPWTVCGTGRPRSLHTHTLSSSVSPPLTSFFSSSSSIHSLWPSPLPQCLSLWLSLPPAPCLSLGLPSPPNPVASTFQDRKVIIKTMKTYMVKFATVSSPNWWLLLVLDQQISSKWTSLCYGVLKFSCWSTGGVQSPGSSGHVWLCGRH